MKPKRIEVKDGNIVVPIYQFSDGRYCIDELVPQHPNDGPVEILLTKTNIDRE